MLIELTMKGNYNGICMYSYCYFCEYEKEETIETKTETERERGNAIEKNVAKIKPRIVYQHEFFVVCLQT